RFWWRARRARPRPGPGRNRRSGCAEATSRRCPDCPGTARSRGPWSRWRWWGCSSGGSSRRSSRCSRNTSWPPRPSWRWPRRTRRRTGRRRRRWPVRAGAWELSFVRWWRCGGTPPWVPPQDCAASRGLPGPQLPGLRTTTGGPDVDGGPRAGSRCGAPVLEPGGDLLQSGVAGRYIEREQRLVRLRFVATPADGALQLGEHVTHHGRLQGEETPARAGRVVTRQDRDGGSGGPVALGQALADRAGCAPSGHVARTQRTDLVVEALDEMDEHAFHGTDPHIDPHARAGNRSGPDVPSAVHGPLHLPAVDAGGAAVDPRLLLAEGFRSLSGTAPVGSRGGRGEQRGASTGEERAGSRQAQHPLRGTAPGHR